LDIWNTRKTKYLPPPLQNTTAPTANSKASTRSKTNTQEIEILQPTQQQHNLENHPMKTKSDEQRKADTDRGKRVTVVRR
jgi:hypothetical protein